MAEQHATPHTIEYGEELAKANRNITLSATDKAAQMRADILAKAQQAQHQELMDNLALLEGSTSLDWERLSPKAQIAYLMTKPFQVRDNDGAYATCKLKFWDAVAFVGRALELKLSILGNDMFPTIKMVAGEARMTGIGISSEAKARVAARQGCKFGPPAFKDVERPWPARARRPVWMAPDAKDWGVECSMTMFVEGVPEGQQAAYTAWLSEWYTGNKSGTAYWDKNPSWMLRIRAKDKCITLASGVGQSEAQQDDAPEVIPPVTEGNVKSTEPPSLVPSPRGLSSGLGAEK